MCVEQCIEVCNIFLFFLNQINKIYVSGYIISSYQENKTHIKFNLNQTDKWGCGKEIQTNI